MKDDYERNIRWSEDMRRKYEAQALGRIVQSFGFTEDELREILGRARHELIEKAKERMR